MPPHGFAGTVIQGIESVAVKADDGRALAAQAHGTAGVRVGQIDNIEAVVFMGVEQAQIGIKRRRLPVGHPAFNR